MTEPSRAVTAFHKIYLLGPTAASGLLLKEGSVSWIRHTFPRTRSLRPFTLRISLPMERDIRLKDLRVFLLAHVISRSTIRR